MVHKKPEFLDRNRQASGRESMGLGSVCGCCCDIPRRSPVHPSAFQCIPVYPSAPCKLERWRRYRDPAKGMRKHAARQAGSKKEKSLDTKLPHIANLNEVRAWAVFAFRSGLVD